MKGRHLAALVALWLCLMPGAMSALCQAEVREAQALYGTAEILNEEDFESLGYGGAPEDVLFVQAVEDAAPCWVVVPKDGPRAEAYAGKGVRYTAETELRAGDRVHFPVVQAGTLEVFANSAEGILQAAGEGELVVETTLTSEHKKFEKKTMRFAVTEDTVMGEPDLEAGMRVTLLYDAEQNALYVWVTNG